MGIDVDNLSNEAFRNLVETEVSEAKKDGFLYDMREIYKISPAVCRQIYIIFSTMQEREISE